MSNISNVLEKYTNFDVTVLKELTTVSVKDDKRITDIVRRFICLKKKQIEQNLAFAMLYDNVHSFALLLCSADEKTRGKLIGHIIMSYKKVNTNSVFNAGIMLSIFNDVIISMRFNDSWKVMHDTIDDFYIAFFQEYHECFFNPYNSNLEKYVLVISSKSDFSFSVRSSYRSNNFKISYN